MTTPEGENGVAVQSGLDLQTVLAAIDERMLGQDPLLERYGRVARAVLLSGEPFETPVASDFPRRLQTGEQTIGVTARFYEASSLASMSYSRAHGHSLLFAEVMTLSLIEDNPFRSASLGTGFAEAGRLKSGRISDVIRNFGVKTATKAEIKHFVEDLEDQIEIAGLE